MRSLLVLAGPWLVACQSAPEQLELATDEGVVASRMPADVKAFEERHQACEHFMGEPDYDAERRAELAKAVAELCPGLDAEGAALARKYADDPTIGATLATYDSLGQ
jgi:hypothetical protein